MERTSFTCSLEPAACYESAANVLKIYREMSLGKIEKETDGFRTPAAPFALLHPGRTKYSALLIHGLNDSAYYLKDIAQVLYARGMNVVTILLPGHGLNVEDMHQVKYQQWLREMRWGMRIAAQLGENVLVGGFSTGGVLATSAAIESKFVKGLLLFAPAIEVQGPFNIGNRAAILTCLKYINRLTFDNDIAENPVKYKTRSANSVCQLDLLIWNLYSLIGENMFLSRTHKIIEKLAAKIKIPTYIVMTTEDHRVPADAILQFAASMRAPVSALVYTPDSRKISPFPGLEIVGGKTLSHSSLVLKANEYNHQMNPDFERLEKSLQNFIESNFKEK